MDLARPPLPPLFDFFLSCRFWLRTDDGHYRPKDLWEPVVYREEPWGWGSGSRPAQNPEGFVNYVVNFPMMGLDICIRILGTILRACLYKPIAVVCNCWLVCQYLRTINSNWCTGDCVAGRWRHFDVCDFDVQCTAQRQQVLLPSSWWCFSFLISLDRIANGRIEDFF